MNSNGLNIMTIKRLLMLSVVGLIAGIISVLGGLTIDNWFFWLYNALFIFLSVDTIDNISKIKTGEDFR